MTKKLMTLPNSSPTSASTTTVRQEFKRGRTREVTVEVKRPRPTSNDSSLIADRDPVLDWGQLAREIVATDLRRKEAKPEKNAQTQVKKEKAPQQAKHNKRHEKEVPKPSRKQKNRQKAQRRQMRALIEEGVLNLRPRRRGALAAVPLEERRMYSVSQLAIRLLQGKLPAKAEAELELKYLQDISVVTWSQKDRDRHAFAERVLRSVIDGIAPADIPKPDGGYFKWPSTDAAGRSDEQATIATEQEVGVLRTVGYKVGESGLAVNARQKILARVYEQALSLPLAPEYLSEWGNPRTATRLQKLANTIAALTRNMKRRNEHAVAIDDWESDLQSLKRRYYDGKYDFQWPKS